MAELQTQATEAPATPVAATLRRPRLHGWRRRWGRALTPILGTLGFIALLQLIVEVGIVSADLVPLPTEVIDQFVRQLGQGDFWAAVLDTLEGWAIGLLLAAAAAIPLGVLAGTTTAAFRSMRFIVDFLRPIPSIALLPLLILVLGIDIEVKIVLAALAGFFPIFFATLYGVQDLDPVARDTATVYKLNRFYRLIFVSLPGSTPYIATGVRISASVALLITVGVEMVVGLPGIGRAIFDAQYNSDLPLMYALVAASGMLGVIIALVFRAAERRVLRWHPSQLREVA